MTGQSEDADARFILPVISPEGENVAWQDVNTVRIGSGPAALTVQADRPLTLPPEYGTPVRFRRLFNPVGGFQSGRRLPVRGADPARRASIHCYSENWR